MNQRIREAVIERDARYLWLWYQQHAVRPEAFESWRERHPVICMVVVLEPTNRWVCSGGQTLDHVKKHLMMGRKAPDDPKHLVSMCVGHNVWHAPSKALREAERAYLGL